MNNSQIDKDEDRIEFKQLSMPSSNQSVELKKKEIQTALNEKIGSMMNKSEKSNQVPVVNSHPVYNAQSFEHSFEAMNSQSNKSLEQKPNEIIRHDLLTKKGSHSIDEDVQSVSNKSSDAKKLVTAAIQKKLKDMKEGVNNGSIVLNNEVEQVRSNETSSLVTNSHATHSHATNEPCTREKKSEVSSLKTDSHATHSHRSDESCNRKKENVSNNSDVEEEIVVPTHSQVLKKEDDNSEVVTVQDSRVSTSTSVKVASALVGMVTLMVLA